MKFVNKKTILLLLASSLILSCTQTGTTTLPAQVNTAGESDNQAYGNVKFNFDFPAKFVPKVDGFSVKAIEAGKINRIKLKIYSATTSFTIERNVELVPGGISASLSLPLDKLYLVTVQGLNDTTSVSGAEIKGYFALKSGVETPTVNVSQVTTPVARILEALKPKFAEEAAKLVKAAPVATVAPTVAPTVVGTPVPGASPTATPAPTATPTSTALSAELSKPPYKIGDVDIAALEDVVKRGLGASHPSMINITPFVDSIMKNKAVPIEVPEIPCLNQVA